MTKSTIKKWFYDENNNLAIWQRPNLPLVIWIISSVARHLAHNRLETFLSLLAFGSLFTWAWLEISAGVNYFRRVVGFIVMAGMLITMSFHSDF